MQGKLRSIFVGAEDVLCQNRADNTLYVQIEDIRPPLNPFETGTAGIKSLKQVFFETLRGYDTPPHDIVCRGQDGFKPVIR